MYVVGREICSSVLLFFKMVYPQHFILNSEDNSHICYKMEENFFNDTMIQYIKFGQNTLFGSRDSVQTSFFGQNLTFKVLV